MSTRRRNRPKVSAQDVLFLVLLGRDVEIVVKPRPGQRLHTQTGIRSDFRRPHR